MIMVKLHAQYLRNRILLFLGLTWRGKMRKNPKFHVSFSKSHSWTKGWLLYGKVQCQISMKIHPFQAKAKEVYSEWQCLDWCFLIIKLSYPSTIIRENIFHSELWRWYSSHIKYFRRYFEEHILNKIGV